MAPSSGAYSGFQVRVREVTASGDGSPLVESRGKAPVGSLGDGLKKLVYESTNFYQRGSTDSYASGGIAIAEMSVRLCLSVRHTLVMGWRVLAFRQNCSELCRAMHTLLAGKL